MKRLPVQHLKPRYYKPIEEQLETFFYDVIFKPLVAIGVDANAQMSQAAHGMLNATENALQAALRNGRVQYEAGTFSGRFSAAISSVLRAIGAKRDARSEVYKLDAAKVPGWVKAEAAHYQQTSRGAHDAMARALDVTQKDLDGILDKTTIRTYKTMREVQKDFRDVAQVIQVNPELSEFSAAKLALDYNQNIKLWIKDFSRKAITELRDVVTTSAQQGYRFDKLIAGIKGRYEVSQNKAKFLARQETGLFMAKYRKERFSEAGVTHYRWSTSHDERVRPAAGVKQRSNNHRILDGRIFAYSQPPVVDTANGRRANPGEDFNCRCVDIPVLDRVLEAA